MTDPTEHPAAHPTENPAGPHTPLPYGTPDTPRLAVRGEARLEFDPEIARIGVTVSARGTDRRAALTDLTRRNEQALTLIKSYGQAIEKLETGTFSLTPQLTDKGRHERIRAYHGRVNLTATLNDFTALGELTTRLGDLELTRIDAPGGPCAPTHPPTAPPAPTPSAKPSSAPANTPKHSAPASTPSSNSPTSEPRTPPPPRPPPCAASPATEAPRPTREPPGPRPRTPAPNRLRQRQRPLHNDPSRTLRPGRAKAEIRSSERLRAHSNTCQQPLIERTLGSHFAILPTNG